MATVGNVASRAGVGVSTASRAVRGRGAGRAPARAPVDVAVAEFGYVPDQAARTLRGGRSHRIGLLLGYVDNLLWAGLTTAIEDTAYAAGYHVLLGMHGSDDRRERAYVDLLIENRAEGAVVYANGAGTAQLERLRAAGVALVLLGTDDCPDFAADRVSVYNVGGAYELTRHLISHGHRCVGAIHGSRGGLRPRAGRGGAGLRGGAGHPRRLDRLRRLPRRLRAAGRAGPAADRAVRGEQQYGPGRARGLPRARAAGAGRPGGRELRRHRDCRQVDPFLTVAADPVPELGRTAVEMLLDRIGDRVGPAARAAILPTRCISRRSCCCPGDGAAGMAEQSVAERKDL